MNAKLKDILVRSAKTFAQSFFGALIVLLSSGSDPIAAISNTAVISALAAAVCAVWNAVISPALTDET